MILQEWALLSSKRANFCCNHLAHYPNLTSKQSLILKCRKHYYPCRPKSRDHPHGMARIYRVVSIGSNIYQLLRSKKSSAR